MNLKIVAIIVIMLYSLVIFYLPITLPTIIDLFNLLFIATLAIITPTIHYYPFNYLLVLIVILKQHYSIAVVIILAITIVIIMRCFCLYSFID